MELQSKFCAFWQVACRLLLLIPLFLLLTHVIKIQAKPLQQNCCVQKMCCARFNYYFFTMASCGDVVDFCSEESCSNDVCTSLSVLSGFHFLYILN